MSKSLRLIAAPDASPAEPEAEPATARARSAAPAAMRGLSIPQAIAVDLLAAGVAAADVARQVGVDRITVWRWQTKHHAFMLALQNARKDHVSAAHSKLTACVPRWVTELDRMICDPETPALLKLKAIEIGLDRAGVGLAPAVDPHGAIRPGFVDSGYDQGAYLEAAKKEERAEDLRNASASIHAEIMRRAKAGEAIGELDFALYNTRADLRDLESDPGPPLVEPTAADLLAISERAKSAAHASIAAPSVVVTLAPSTPPGSIYRSEVPPGTYETEGQAWIGGTYLAIIADRSPAVASPEVVPRNFGDEIAALRARLGGSRNP